MISLCDANYQTDRTNAVQRLLDVEMMDRGQLDALQLELLKDSYDRAVRNSPHYASLHRTGTLPDRIERMSGLASLPFTTKDQLRAAYPFGLLAVPRENLIRYGESTGTTGEPTSSYITHEDWIQGNVWVEHAFRNFFRSGEMVFVAIPYELAFASYDIDRALEAVGATVVSVGILNQVCPFDRMVDMIHELRPSCVVCTPTRALRIYDKFIEKGYDVRQSGLNKLFVVGETCSAAKLHRICQLWNIDTIVNAYGSTETNSLALPCRFGRLHLTEDRHLFEVVDPETNAPVASGDRGELIITSLVAKAMPLLRYRSGDLVELDEIQCSCGSTRRVVHHHGRVADRFVIGTTVIQRLDLEQVVLSNPNVGIYYVADVQDDRLHIFVTPEDDERNTCLAISEQVRKIWAVPVEVKPIDRVVLSRAMDRMLKPGSLSMSDIVAAA